MLGLKKKQKKPSETEAIEPNKAKEITKMDKVKQREARKKIKNRKKLQKKHKKLNIREKNDEFAPLFGYDYRPSYINAGNRCATILKLVNKYGTNHRASFGWFVNLIPDSSEEGRVKTILIEGDKVMNPKQQDEIFKNNINKVIKGHSVENDSAKDNEGDRTIKEMVVNDLKSASRDDAKQGKAIDCFLYLIIFGDTPYHVSNQLRRINENYKDEMNGLQAMSVAGNQENMFTSMLTPPKGDKNDYTWMAKDFVGNDHAVRRGLNDDDGVTVGEITEDYTGGQALMSLYKSIKKRAVVSSYDNSTIFRYEGYPDLTASSLWGQRIANDTVVNGHRVFHIVMNGFEYGVDDFTIDEEQPKFVCPISLDRQIGRVDLSKGHLNPVEMFGDIERDKDNISQIFNTNVNKITHMFSLMSGRTITNKQKTMLQKGIIQFYINKRMWIESAEKYPNATRVFGVKSETVPKMGMLTKQLKDLVLEHARGDGEFTLQSEVSDAKHLESVMNNALERYRSIVNTETTLPNPKTIKKLQMYYDLSKLSQDPAMMEAQFLNIFNYVLTACEKGDVIMFHGLDRISIETLSIIKNRLDTASKQGIKMVYLFDTIGGSKHKTEVEYSTIFNTESILYQSLDDDFGFTIFGAMNYKDLENYQIKINQNLTERLQAILTATNSPYQYQIRRPSDLTTVMVNAQFFV
ncbi:TPA: hypothetical protein ACK0CK_002652 [Staphylococcus aureus]